MSRYMAKNLESKQKDWNSATQRRISLTASALSSMKVMKILGFSTETEVLLQTLRAQELEMAKEVRWMMVAYNASANALGIFSPILTFVIFVILANLRGEALDAETAFTTTALLGLVTHPANMIMTIVPQAIGSLAAFGRIQDYLVQPSVADNRRLLETKVTEDHSLAVCFEAVTVHAPLSARPVLQNVSFLVNKGTFLICAGAVGSGKTVLAKCILGENAASSGTVSVSSKRIAYCEQSPWLPSGTLKEAVCGFGKFEAVWYRHVVKLCCLDEDITAMPLRDDTVIGSRGMKLSGGQRQRVFLSLGLQTSQVDNSCSLVVAKHFDLADSLIILENGSVTYQGPPDGIREEAVHISQMYHNTTVPTENADHLEAHKTVEGQALKVTEAMADLSRSTGDFSLYGTLKTRTP
ncbi:hypothetical protein IL306_007338 [Fusarium sp. DS 682]|nr:hypothetical protein IL306_007338 [Fusarium sp. DS 682]